MIASCFLLVFSPLTYLPCCHETYSHRIAFFFLIIAQSYFFYRLFDILHQQRRIYGPLRRPSSHNTVLAFWRLLPKCSVSI